MSCPSGGVQVQQWDGEDLIQSRTIHSGVTLDESDEVITWTQRLTLENGQLVFQVSDGHSNTWGDFGGDELTISASTSLHRLNNYRPGTSVSESQVNYAENRVESLVLKKLVWVTQDGEVHEQNAPIPIDTSLDN
jgi:hypothetical protein